MELIPWTRSLYRIIVGGNDVSDRIAPHLISVQVVDKAGQTSDTARVTLDDRDGQFALPTKGDPMVVYLGDTARGVVERFNGFVDTVESQGDRGGGMRLEISGKGQDNTSAIKQPNQKHWDDKPLSDVMSEAGRLAGLSGVDVHPSLANLRRPYWSMDEESVIHFGRRIASEVGGTFKIVGTKGVLVPRSAGVSASGKALSVITAQRGVNLISWALAPDIARPQYQKVRARYYDAKQAKWLEKEVEVPGGSGASGGASTRNGVTFSRADEAEAEKAAGAEGTDSEREKGGGRVDIVGNPQAVAEATCQVIGARPGIDGAYTIESVTDTLTRGGGYITSLDLVRPSGSAGSDNR